MSPILLSAAVCFLLAGAVLCAMLSRAKAANAIGGIVAVVGAAVAIASAVHALQTGDETLQLPWSVPFGSFHISIDGLSAFFILAISAVCALGGVYGVSYLRHYKGKNLGASWFFFNLLFASMLMVVTAWNAVLFLAAWEVMSLSSFFLVTFEHERQEVRKAGWVYLISAHVGMACLLAMFILLGRASGSMDFASFGSMSQPVAHASLILVLAVVGFGTKAGFMPLHVWLPEAHPAAPSHVSAVMSGVMIKTGIYGLLRTLTFLGPPPAWWGLLLIGIGLVSGVLGVLFALAQHDLKRLLAYHSVENIGIIALGLGTGLLGLSLQSTPMAVLGFGGGLLHVLNHACFKGLLFLGAGAVLHGTGSRELDRMGGLLKRLPWTGWTFLVGAVAICGLPPLNGFVSELLIYLGALKGVRWATGSHLPLVVGVVVGLALIGGLASACFTKAFGAVFLGEPRSAQAAGSHECGGLMRLAMLVLAAGCAAIGLLGPFVIVAMAPAITVVAGMPSESIRATMAGPREILSAVVAASIVLLVLTGGLMVFRRWLLAGRDVSSTVTWDCGYARPTARMQYTASSFAQPLTWFFRVFLQTHTKLAPPVDFFPASASLVTHTDDVCREKFYRPMFRSVGWLLSRLRWLQHGRVQIYVLYIALTLLALLLWKLE